jgi:hypothetical protein
MIRLTAAGTSTSRINIGLEPISDEPPAGGFGIDAFGDSEFGAPA